MVLLRAVEPYEGIDLMRQARPGRKDREITSGPGKLCDALGIDRSYNGADLLGERVWLEDMGYNLPAQSIVSGPRIGINYAEEFVSKPWRFWIRDNPFVSRF